VIGQTLSHYKILSEISRGGMGIVYRALDMKLEREVALKVLPPELVADSERKRRFVQEAKAAAKLDHPHIGMVFEIDEVDGFSFIAMELIRGEQLRDTIAKGTIPLRRALEIATDIAEGLAKAHDEGIVHRDLKPANIMVADDGHTKIIDFGLAKLVEPLAGEGSDIETLTRGETDAGKIMGTVSYMSPEQIRGQKIDHRSDVFSFGSTLCEILTQKAAFQGSTGADIIGAILRDPAPILLSGEIKAPKEITTDLQRILDKCLAKEPESRYQSVHELREDLDQVSALAPSIAQKRERPTPRWRLWIMAAVSAAVAVAFALDIGGLVGRFVGRPSKPQISSIAVLPLENLSGDPEQEYFADGMTEALIMDLAQVKSLKTISRTSVMQYKHIRKPLREIAQELGVDAVVEGSILRSGNRIRVTAQLIDAETDENLWAKGYEREMKDILSLQREVARSIVEEIRIELTPQEERRLSDVEKVSPAAYDAYLNGRFHWNRRSEEGSRKAIEYFETAIKTEPTYARAYAGLADAYNVLGWYQLLPSKAAFPEATRFAQRALGLDERLGEAYISLGYSLFLHDWQWTKADESFRRGVELSPNYATGHHWYSFFLAAMGRTSESLERERRALQLDPLSLIINRGMGHRLYYARMYDAAIEAELKALEMSPSFVPALITLGHAYLQKGLLDEALSAFSKASSLSEGSGFDAPAVGYAYAVAGRRDQALEILDEYRRREADSYVSPYNIAAIYLGLNEQDKALEYLEKAFTERVCGLAFINVEPLWDPLRSHPRFKDILRRMNFPE
jgi:serine/threonine protein kinase/tetratricopeptide (TPR) repeat protein